MLSLFRVSLFRVSGQLWRPPGMLRIFAARAAAPALRRGIPSFAVRLNQQNSGPGHGSSGMFADNDAVRRRLLYRSKMRGVAS